MSDLDSQELQIKLTYLERHVEEQDKVIYAVRKELSQLERKLEQLEERLDLADNARPGPPPDERPPHY